ncbi:MAG: redoxin domain-containing protein [Gammaproteobacteria bacterium]|nr:redoxin domain-containing protein [Gammaproteobacteria bacterium]
MSQGKGVPRHKLLIAVVAVAALALGAVASFLTSRQEAPQIDGLLWPHSKALGEFTLEDHHHEAFTLESMTGAWTLLFFGYTHCPDVCPVTLSVLKNAVAMMGAAGAEPPRVVFVSVDPARDNLEHLAAYVSHFNPEFLGVTGSESNLGAFARQLGVLYMRADPDNGGDYLVDHTAAVFLIDPRGHLVALFQAPHVAKTFARDIPKIQDLEWN